MGGNILKDTGLSKGQDPVCGAHKLIIEAWISTLVLVEGTSLVAQESTLK